MANKLMLMLVLTTYITMANGLLGGLIEVCINPGLARKTLTGYVHVIREATNASLVVNETPVTGLATQVPPYSAGYKFALNRPITNTPSYSPTGDGVVEGSMSCVKVGECILIADIKLVNETGYVTLQGRYDNSVASNVFPITGGVGEDYYSFGNATFTRLYTYGVNGLNAVYSLTAILYIIGLC